MSECTCYLVKGKYCNQCNPKLSTEYLCGQLNDLRIKNAEMETENERLQKAIAILDQSLNAVKAKAIEDFCFFVEKQFRHALTEPLQKYKALQEPDEVNSD